MSEKESWEDQSFEWYRHPLIHFPLWLIFTFRFFDFLDKLNDYEGFFSLGLFVFITGLWGIVSKMFFLRVPFLGQYIYENGYVLHANLVLIMLGTLISLCSIIFGGTIVVSNFIDILLESRFLSGNAIFMWIV